MGNSNSLGEFRLLDVLCPLGIRLFGAPAKKPLLDLTFEKLSGMKTVKIGVIGLGPRGLTVLERIVAHERAQKSANIELYLFDPSEPGAGCHDPEQADYLLVNTVAAQITLFSDPSVKNSGPILEGPCFYQWLQNQKRLGQLDDEYPNLALSPDTYYSRSLFGRYLQWVYHYLCELAPRHLKIYLIRSAVLCAERVIDGDWMLQTEDTKHRVNFLFLTTGHTKPKIVRAGNTTIVGDPYPIHKTLSFIGSHMTVGIEGMGLSYFDVLADLTVGRGGKFIASGTTGGLEYVASGNEPRIIAFSRSGLPLSTRAINQKGVSIQYKPRFLHVAAMRKLRGKRKLDFHADVFPLLLADMQYAYYEAYLRAGKNPITTLLFCNQFACANAEERQALISANIPAEDRFSWESMVAPVPKAALSTHATFKEWLLDYLRRDLHEARKGNLDSPLKAASDVLRDLRDNLRAAIDFGGLTEESHRWLYSEFLPIMNRMAVGPPASRIDEMIALIQAGVLEADWGPGAFCDRHESANGMRRFSSSIWPEKTADLHVLVQARVPMHSPQDDASPLLQGLLQAGHVRLFRNGDFHPGGIEINRDFNWVSKEGPVIVNAWALGIPTEGVKFYTFVVPRPGVGSTAVVDAGCAVGKMLSLVTGQTLPKHSAETTAPK